MLPDTKTPTQKKTTNKNHNPHQAGNNSNQIRRDVHGVLLFDKPLGDSSNTALQKVKRLFNAKKAGHTGSLDPLASGLLPICFGEATKLSNYLLDADKTYHFTCRLGVTTTTGDAEGEVLNRQPVQAYQKEQVETVLARFSGEIEQIPPMYSALKHQGKRLYELARQGISVEREPRRVTIHELRLLNLTDDQLECIVRSSKGMYVRTLAEDIGAELGCGAHVIQLRRLSVGAYQNPQMITLEDLQTRLDQHDMAALDELLLPLDSALSAWPKLLLNDELTAYIKSGNPVRVRQSPAQGWLRLYDSNERFIGIGEVLPDGRVAPRRLFKHS